MERAAEYKQPDLEQIRASLAQTLAGLAAEFQLDESALQEKLDDVLASETTEDSEEIHWKELYGSVKAEALKKPEVLAKLKKFLQTKGYTAFGPIHEEDQTDVVIKKLHTYLFDKGTGALSRDEQAELYYFVINNIFDVT